MRLHPPLSEEVALAWLRGRAAELWGPVRVPDLEATLRSMAAAMATISAATLPDELEPLFP